MKIIAVIVTYNGIEWVDKCINSLLNSSSSLDILIVDNGSSDDICNHIANSYSNIILIQQKYNLGFGQANNIGLEYALSNNYDNVILLNQDAFVDEKAIEILVNHSVENPHVGIWSPFHKSYDTLNIEQYFEQYILKEYTPQYILDLKKNEIKNIYESIFIHAACWFMPISTVKKIGGFDPLFFHYGEDNDYIQRLKYNKLSIAFVTNSILYHNGTNDTMVKAQNNELYWLNNEFIKFKNPYASNIGALKLFLSNGIKFLFGRNRQAKNAFLKNSSRFIKMLDSRKRQYQELAYLKNTLSQ